MKPTIVLVHGAFAESASRSGVIDSLSSAGYRVVAAANPLRNLVADAASVAHLIQTIEWPVVLWKSPLVVPVRLLGASGRAMAGGGPLPTDRGPRGQQTFDRWLAGSAARSTTRQARRDEDSRPSPSRGGSGQETTDGGLR